MTHSQRTIPIQPIIEAFMSGDNEQFYIFKNQIARYVNTHRSLSRDAKEDIVADIIAALLQNFRSGRFRGDSIKALNVYIFMIVRNTVCNYLRRSNESSWRIESGESTDKESASPDIGMANKDLISKVLEQIEEKCANLLRMKFHLGLSNQEVADRMVMSKNATSTAISRCLDRIKKLKIIKELV